jgi:hypothetical protein
VRKRRTHDSVARAVAQSHTGTNTRATSAPTTVSLTGVMTAQSGNTVLGELPNGTYEGMHTVSGGRVQINGGGNVAISWSLTEVR